MRGPKGSPGIPGRDGIPGISGERSVFVINDYNINKLKWSAWDARRRWTYWNNRRKRR